MSEITLSKAETKLVLAAAERGGSLELPRTLKPSTRERMLGRLLRDGLVTAEGAGHLLSPAGYGAVGLKPPRIERRPADAVDGRQPPAPRVNKGLLIQNLLQRQDGASVVELMEATGWLRHTTRAALSRVRTGGQALLKSQRSDGTTAYRIVADEPAPLPKRRSRSRSRSAVAAEASAA